MCKQTFLGKGPDKRGAFSKAGYRSSAALWVARREWTFFCCLNWPRGQGPDCTRAAEKKVTRHMAQSFLGQKRLRKYYGKIREVLDMPNLNAHRW